MYIFTEIFEVRIKHYNIKNNINNKNSNQNRKEL